MNIEINGQCKVTWKHRSRRFNQALLGKQAWIIWSNPTSLMSRVLKGKYFKRGTFLECGIGSRPSFVWRSIKHGRELLTQGLVRSIGNGSSTNVWGEKWIIIDTIPRPPMYKENSIVNLALHVSDLLIEGTSMWNQNLLSQTFTPEDVKRMLMIRTCVNQEDSIRWGFTRNGYYSTESGYKLLEALINFEHPQTSPTPH